MNQEKKEENCAEKTSAPVQMQAWNPPKIDEQALSEFKIKFGNLLSRIAIKRGALRDVILKKAEGLNENEKRLVQDTLGDFGLISDSIEMKKQAIEKMETFFDCIESYFLGGDSRVHECLWSMGADNVSKIDKSLSDSGEKKIVNSLHKFIFTFEDFVRLSDRDVQRIMREIDSDWLEKALLIASDEVKEKFFSNMSTRIASMLKDNMKNLKNFPEIESLKFQNKIISSVSRLAYYGDIVIPSFNEFEDNILANIF